MINRVFRLTAPGQIVTELCELSFASGVIVRPEYLSICAADQRYYRGSRPGDIMRKKLPMALIHEACGIVVSDVSGKLKPGTRVLMVPNIDGENCTARPNYDSSSRFCSSDTDGFLQEYVSLRPECVLPYSGIEPQTAVLCELCSVAFHAVDTLKSCAHKRREDIAVFGDGSLGYICALMIKELLPQARLHVFGMSDEKLSFFSFADEIYRSDLEHCSGCFDHAFECVGGEGSQEAIESIISEVRPQGTIVLLGVSEKPVAIDTRTVLEKGLTLVGRSRSTREDFKKCERLLRTDATLRRELSKIIHAQYEVKNAADICRAFDDDASSPFKTVIKWAV